MDSACCSSCSGWRALAGMRLCGPLADCHGPRIVMVCAVPLLGLALTGSALANDAVSLAVAVVPFGFVNGALDVSMNAHAVAVQRRYRRAIMAALSPWVPLAVIGWAGYGIGLSGCVPQIFTIAGNANPATSGANLSLVAGTGYFGLLAGPATIGALARFVPLSLALLLPIGCCAVAVVLASGIRKAGRPIVGADSTISTTPSTTP